MKKIKDMEKVLVLSIGHMVNDWYMNYLQTLLTFLVAAGISMSRGSFLISAFTVASSLMQPVFGYLSDRRNLRWLVFMGTLWMAVLLSLIGLVHNYGLMLLIVSLAGLGTAAFHPQASAMTARYAGQRKGFIQAVFIAMGNVGWALTPLIAIPVVENFGLKATPVFAIPGVLMSLLLYAVASKDPYQVKEKAGPVIPALRAAWKQLVKVMLVVATRSLTYFGLVAFLPVYLEKHGTSAIAAGRTVFVMLFAGAIGGLVGGFISDKVGRKIVIIISLILATPAFYLFLACHGPISMIFLAVAGALLLSTFSVTVVIAQKAIVNNAAMASGLMLGFGTGIGGLGVSVMGILAEKFNSGLVIHILVSLPIFAGLLGMAIKEQKEVNQKP